MQNRIHHLDIRGAIAPFTFLQINRAFREIGQGELLDIQGDDSDTRRNIFQVMNGFHFQIVEIEDRKTCFRICLKKEMITEGEQTDDRNNSETL